MFHRKGIKIMITFILPTYNDAETIENSIKSINNLGLKYYELIIANDCSKDNTLDILKKLKRKYKFTLICNKINQGKARTVNKCLNIAKGDYIFIIDTDIEFSKYNFDEMMFNLKKDGVGAVSCRYSVSNQGIFSSMENIEFGMMGIINGMYSNSLTIWGGCCAYKKDALQKINGLKENMLAEDMDSALRLKNEGYKIIQCNQSVSTYSENDLNKWIKRKIRWTSGGIQCLIHNPKYFFKNPTYIFIFFFYGFLFNLLIYYLMNNIPINFLIIFCFYSLISILFAGINSKSLSEFTILGFVFAFLYYPIFSMISSIGLIIGIYKNFKLKDGERAW